MLIRTITPNGTPVAFESEGINTIVATEKGTHIVGGHNGLQMEVFVGESVDMILLRAAGVNLPTPPLPAPVSAKKPVGRKPAAKKK